MYMYKIYHGNTVQVPFSKNFAPPFTQSEANINININVNIILFPREIFQPLCFYSCVYLHEPI